MVETLDSTDEFFPQGRRSSAESVSNRKSQRGSYASYELPETLGGNATKLKRPSSQAGLSKAVNARLKLDATLSPSLTSLRFNPQNLRNEARVHQGEYISVQMLRHRPRRHPAWAGPQEVKLSRTDRSLVEKSGNVDFTPSSPSSNFGDSPSRRKASPRSGKMTREKSVFLSADNNKANLLKNAHNRSLTEARHTTEYVSWSKQVSQASTSALTDIQTRKLMAKPRIQQVFNLLQEPKTALLHRDQLDRALKAVGSSVLEQNLEAFVINEVFETLPEGADGITFREFCSIVAALHERRHMALRERFEELDDDDSGEISLQEFRTLIWDLGFTVNQQEVEKLFAEVDTDGSGFIDFDEFEVAVSNSLENYGFTREEVHEFEGLFDRYDQDKSGKLSPDELASALGWFGTPTSIAQAEELFEICGHFDGEPLTKSEFLRVMRIRLQQQIDAIRAQFAANDVDKSGSLDVAEVGDLVIELGYSTSSDALKECIRTVRVDAGKRGLVFEEVLELVELLRRCEGFSEREVAELDEVFRLQDPASKGCLRDFELGYALQWLGYGINSSRRFALMSAADVDKTGTIEFGEFLKVVRMLHEQEACEAKKFARDYGTRRTFSETCLRDVLNNLGYSPQKSALGQIVKQCLLGLTRNIERDDVLLVIRKVRQGEVLRRQQVAGLPDEQASRLRSRFGRRIEAGKGIDPADLVKFIMEAYPKVRHNRLDQQKAEELATDASHNREGGWLTMSDLFAVMQKFRHHNDEKSWKHQQEIAARAGFSPQQVATFRELYVQGDVNSDMLSLDEFLRMLQGGAFPDITAEGQQEMWRHANERDGADVIDFAAFLEMMETGKTFVKSDRRSSVTMGSKDQTQHGHSKESKVDRLFSEAETPDRNTFESDTFVS
mmetsp:Transcript_58760/g.137164  ORF Transcript_58760/g.137164 Transcript_58760/m.137164 type:complete len:895 (+) Transcript_58760:110-2794(+)